MSVQFGSYPPGFPPAPAPRRRSIAPWWVGLIILGTGAILALVWFIMGGLPFSNHAAYGRVPVPGQGQVALPAGVVWLYFEEEGIFGEDDSADMPSDLSVTANGPSGPLVISRVSDMLFATNVNNVGYVPFGQADVASAGSYAVTTSGSPTSAEAPKVTFGEGPWNPFGPAWVGSLVILAPFAILALILVLPLRRS
jgi:hypothetical protein